MTKERLEINMENSLKSRLWIWGQDPGTHHAERDNVYNLPGENKMTPDEGARYLGVENVCRVVMEDKPEPPFDGEAEKLKEFPKVAWSIIGSCGSARNHGGGNDLDEVIDLSKKYPNIVAGIMDDFMCPSRMSVYTPDIIRGYADILHAHNLSMWTVIYEHELMDEAAPYLAECDVITFWTWCGSNLKNLEENFSRVRSLCTPDKSLMVGCYLWNYGESRPLTMDEMKYQLDVYGAWLAEGKVDGIIFCSNCICDIGLDTVAYAKEWIARL